MEKRGQGIAKKKRGVDRGEKVETRIVHKVIYTLIVICLKISVSQDGQF